MQFSDAVFGSRGAIFRAGSGVLQAVVAASSAEAPTEESQMASMAQAKKDAIAKGTAALKSSRGSRTACPDKAEQVIAKLGVDSEVVKSLNAQAQVEKFAAAIQSMEERLGGMKNWTRDNFADEQRAIAEESDTLEAMAVSMEGMMKTLQEAKMKAKTSQAVQKRKNRQAVMKLTAVYEKNGMPPMLGGFLRDVVFGIGANCAEQKDPTLDRNKAKSTLEKLTATTDFTKPVYFPADAPNDIYEKFNLWYLSYRPRLGANMKRMATWFQENPAQRLSLAKMSLAQDHDVLKLDWVSDALKIVDEKVVPDSLVGFGSPLIFGHCPESARFTFTDFPWLGISYFIKALTEDMLLVSWPLDGQVISAGSLAWVEKMNEGAGALDDKLSWVMLRAGDLVWMPPCRGSMVVSLPVQAGCDKNEGTHRYAAFQPMFSEAALKAIGSPRREAVMAALADYIATAKDDVLVGAYGEQVSDWLSAKGFLKSTM